jgi:tetratricopeptide (TPR) repeat protein
MNADPRSEPAADDHESAYELLQRGLALTRRRHHAQAAIVLARAARAEPRKGSILEPLGRAYHLTWQYDLARETFELLLEVDPLNHWAHSPWPKPSPPRSSGRGPNALATGDRDGAPIGCTAERSGGSVRSAPAA